MSMKFFDEKEDVKYLRLQKDSYLYVLVVTLIWGIIAHGYMYFNSILLHDTLQALNQGGSDITWKISLGRFMQPVNILFIRGVIAAPWLIGLFSLFWISITTYVVIKVLDIENKLLVILTCGIFATNAVITITNASYAHECDAFMLALMFSVLSVYVFERYRYGFMLAPISIVISCGFYQGYFSCTVIFFMIIILKNIFDGYTPNKIIKKGIQSILVLIIGLILYYISYKFILVVLGINESNSSNSLKTLFEFAQGNILYQVIKLQVAFLRDAMLLPSDVLSIIKNPYHAMTIGLNLFLCLLSVIKMIQFLRRKRIVVINRWILMLLICLMPCGMSIAYILGNQLGGSLMTYSFSFVYILVIYIIGQDSTNKQINIQKISVLLLSIVLLRNIQYSNSVYLEKDLVTQASLSTMTRIVYAIEQTEGYEMGKSEVVFVGDLSGSLAMKRTRSGFENFLGRGVDFNGAVVNNSTYSKYMEYILGYSMKVASGSISEEFKNNEQVKAMPIFPSKGYCEIIDDKIVVKLKN